MEMLNFGIRGSERPLSAPALLMDAAVEDNSALTDESQSGSRDGFLLTEALRAAQQAPDVRRGRVEALKALVSAGEYEVDCGALARAIAMEDGAVFSL